VGSSCKDLQEQAGPEDSANRCQLNSLRSCTSFMCCHDRWYLIDTRCFCLYGTLQPCTVHVLPERYRPVVKLLAAATVDSTGLADAAPAALTPP
jgi:hypothetical protein